MAIRNVILEGDPLLREKTKTITEFDAKLSDFIDDLFETMRYENGVGLAAPQVGALKRVCVISPDDGETNYELVNPVIVKASGSQIAPEGCLSIPNVRAKVKRPKKITVEFQDRTGAFKKIIAEGFLATIFCHEIDHLDGILFIDKRVE